MKFFRIAAALLVTGAVTVGGALAQNSAIAIDGQFDDWANVPTIATDPADNPGSIDFVALQVANDENFVYIRYTLAAPANPQKGAGVYLSIDEDNNPATGFNPFGLGVIGSEASWQNDFPFEQATENFNTGNGLSDATYAASPYATETTSVEIKIPRTAKHNATAKRVFPENGKTIRIALWTEEGANDLISAQYTLTGPTTE